MPSDRRVASECSKRFLEIWLRDEFIEDRRLVFNQCVFDPAHEPCSILMESNRKYHHIVINNHSYGTNISDKHISEMWKKLGESVTTIEIGRSYHFSSFSWEKLPKLKTIKVASMSQLGNFIDLPYSLDKLVIGEINEDDDNGFDEDDDQNNGLDDLDLSSDTIIEVNSIYLSNDAYDFIRIQNLQKLGIDEVWASEFEKLQSKSLKFLDLQPSLEENEGTEKYFDNFEERFPSLEHLRLRMFKILPHTNWPCLKELKVDEVPQKELERLKTFENLETLEIQLNYEIDYDDDFSDSEPEPKEATGEIQCFFVHEPYLNKNLKTLKISFYPVEPDRTCITCFKVMTETFPKLENLVCEFSISNEHLKHLQANSPKLKCLSIQSEGSQTTLSFENFPNLSELTLSQHVRPDLEIWPLMPQLRKLDVRFDNLNNSTVKTFEKVPALEELKFYCHKMDDDHHRLIETMMRPLKRLKSLDFTCNRVNTLNPNIVDTIATYCIYLRHIHFRNNFKGENDADILRKTFKKHSSIRSINKIHANEKGEEGLRALARSANDSFDFGF